MEYLTTDEVADVLRCQAKDRLRQARAWLRRRNVPFVRVGKTKIYRRADVEDALAAARETPEGRPAPESVSDRLRRMRGG